MAKKQSEQEIKDDEKLAGDEMVESTNNSKLIDEFISEKLKGITAVKDYEMTIGDKKETFGVITNNILYDFDITEEEFKRKVEFLHPVSTQDTSGIKFQYRVVTKQDGKFKVKYKSDSVVKKGGKVARINTGI